jgi:Putative restriction endonuclease
LISVDFASDEDTDMFSRDKMSIYQTIGVPEVWAYRNGHIKIYQLQESQYAEVIDSPTFPAVNIRQIQQWIQYREASNDLTTLREVRHFCRETIRPIVSTRILKPDDTENI